MLRSFCAATVLLAACSAEPERNVAGKESTVPDPATVGDLSNQPPSSPSSSVVNEADPRGAQAAAAVLRRYFALIEGGRQDEAAELWVDDDAAKSSAAELSRFGDFRPNIAAPGRIEGAAGSLFVRISLQILRDSGSGAESLADGTAVLRRSNDIPGSTAEQRRWRIDRIALQPPAVPQQPTHRFVGRWASETRNCQSLTWRFTATSLRTPAGSVCNFREVDEVPGGYDIAARCTAEGPPTDDKLQLRFAESARALLFESQTIADAGLVRCP